MPIPPSKETAGKTLHQGSASSLGVGPAGTTDSFAKKTFSQTHSYSGAGSEKINLVKDGAIAASSGDEPFKASSSVAVASVSGGPQKPGKTSYYHNSKDKNLKPVYVTWSHKIVENKYFVALTTLLTIYALTGDDLRLICTDKPADMTFNYIVMVCILVFGVELLLSCLGKDDYFLGFFFVLDTISTATLVLDLTWVANELASGGDDEEQVSNARAGRTARIGAKAGRVVRVIRLVRILKLYKAIHEARKKKQKEEQEKAKGPGDEDDWDDEDIEQQEQAADNNNAQSQRESRVGKKLSEMTTRRVIILVLIMLLILPQLRPEQADQSAVSAFYGADNVWQTFVITLNDTSTKVDYERAFLQYVFYHNWFASRGFCPEGRECSEMYYSHLFWVGIQGQDLGVVQDKASKARVASSTMTEWDQETKTQDDIYNYGTMPGEALQTLTSPWEQRCDLETRVRLGLSLLDGSMDDTVSYKVKCPEDLRIPERKKYWARMQTYEEYDVWHFSFYFDLRPFIRMDAGFNLCITFFVCIVLCVASMYFSNDANNLVLTPVENMIKRVEAIRENPLIAMKMADEEFKAEEVAKAKEKKQAKERVQKAARDVMSCSCMLKAKSQEPMETVILEKTIIKLGSLLALGFGEAGANIIGHNMRGADSAGVNAMIPGMRVECIIGVARIRDFSTATEVLQAKIMTFVNQIAEIVHGVVDEYHGSANKNNGDMFLIIWRIEEMNRRLKMRMAEMSLCAFAKILGSLHRSFLLAGYREHPGLQQRLGSDCRVNLSFGLHCGWAIEGAVGSEFKIDASYLSPNVSIANSIERSTQMYGISFIIAQSVVELCGEHMVNQCRLIDKVIITGSVEAIQLFSLDLDYMSVEKEDLWKMHLTWNTRQRYKARQFLESEKSQKLSEDVQIVDNFNTDPIIRVMRKRYTVQFGQCFNMGYQNYSQGEWGVARRMLVGTLRMLGVEDGPSGALLRFMENFAFEAPKSWAGVRELDRGVVI